jgi:hypothetical protein
MPQTLPVMVKSQTQASLVTMPMSDSDNSVGRGKPMTFKKLLEKVEENQDKNNEP